MVLLFAGAEVVEEGDEVVDIYYAVATGRSDVGKTQPRVARTDGIQDKDEIEHIDLAVTGGDGGRKDITQARGLVRTPEFKGSPSLLTIHASDPDQY